MGSNNMINEVENHFGRYSTLFHKRYTDIQLENSLNSGKMCANVSRCLECKDSVDDFINKHIVFIDKGTRNIKSKIYIPLNKTIDIDKFRYLSSDKIK